MTQVATPDAASDLRDVEQFLFREARLIDDCHFSEWLTLFTEDGIYWIPIDPDQPPTQCVSLVYDTSLAREERVYHIEEVGFPSQSPPSRTLHFVTNVEITERAGAELTVFSNQMIHELRVGDYRQVGLGDRRIFSARVRYRLVRGPSGLLIAEKKIILLDRDVSVGNMTMIL